MSQVEHRAWNAKNDPGTRQLCEQCGEFIRAEVASILRSMGLPADHAEHVARELHISHVGDLTTVRYLGEAITFHVGYVAESFFVLPVEPV